MTTPESAQALARLLVERGVSQQELADALGRSPRMVRFVLAGQKPGRNLVPALRELVARGQVSEQPARRTNAKTKAPVPVRARGGGTRVPPGPTPQRLRFAARGTRTIELLAFEDSAEMDARALRFITGASKSRQRLQFLLTLGDGTTVPFGERGGYESYGKNGVLAQIKAAGGFLAWFFPEIRDTKLAASYGNAGGINSDTEPFADWQSIEITRFGARRVGRRR